MKALAAGALAEGLQTQRLEPLLQFRRGGATTWRTHLGRGVEIEDQTSRHVGLIRHAVPGMQFEAATAPRRQRLHLVDGR